MGRGRQLGLLFACACAWMLFAVPAAQAFEFTCDPADPNANVWVGGPGNWSSASNWSQGSVPDAADAVCVGDEATVDVDVDVAGLLTSGLVVPAGRSVTARHAQLSLATIEGRLVVGGAPSSFLAGDAVVTGTLETAGAVSASTFIIRGLAGSGGTVRATVPTTIDSIDTRGSLELGAGTDLTASSIAIVDGSLTGTGTLRGAQLAIGSSSGTIQLAADVDLERLTFAGDALVTGRVKTLSMDVEDHAELRGAMLEDESTLLITGDGDLQLTGGTTLDAPSIMSQVDVQLDDCSTTTQLTQITIQTGRFAVNDLSCIDPPSGTTRRVTASVPGQGPILAGSGALTAGGTLVLEESAAIAAGATITDGATSVQLQQMNLRIDGPGTATLVGFDPISDYYLLSAGSNQRLVLDSPSGGDGALGGMRFIVLEEGGAAEVRDPAPRAFGWATGEQVESGSTPVRYTANGIAYEPYRNLLFLRGGTWPAGASARAREVSGFGSIATDLVADSLRAERGTLTVTGRLVAQVAGVRHATGVNDGVLDLRGATSQDIGRFAVSGPDAPAPVPSVAASDSRLAAPGIARSFIAIAPSRIAIPAGLAYSIAPSTGQLQLVDGVAPSAVTALVATSHGSPSPDTTIDVAWTAATDAGTSPVAGYAVTFTQSSDADPGTAITTTGTSYTSASLPPGRWWVHVRALDGVGNAGPVAHAGPFTIERTCAGDADCDGIPNALEPIVRVGSSLGNVLLGRGGADRLSGAGGNDTLRGYGGNDRLDGGSGRDLLDGGLGNDALLCGAGNGDRALGGAGTDTVSCRDARPSRLDRDVIDCGGGRDRATVDRFDVVRNCERVLRR